MPKPPVGPEDPKNPWPNWPRTLKTTSSHEEGCTRRWNINSLEFIGKDGKLTGVRVQEIDWKPNPEGGRPLMVEKGKPEVIKADMVLLATSPRCWYAPWQAEEKLLPKLINSLLNEIRPYQQFLNIDSVARAPGGVPVFLFLTSLRLVLLLRKAFAFALSAKFLNAKKKST